MSDQARPRNVNKRRRLEDRQAEASEASLQAQLKVAELKAQLEQAKKLRVQRDVERFEEEEAAVAAAANDDNDAAAAESVGEEEHEAPQGPTNAQRAPTTGSGTAEDPMM